MFSQETLTKKLCCGLVLSRNLDKNPFIAKKPSIKQGLPVNKKRLLTAAFISVLLLSAVAGTQFVNLARANPYSQARDSGVRAAPHSTEPPRISIFSPLNYTIHDTDNVSLTFVVRVGESANASGMRIYSVYYRADWLQNDIKVNSFELSQAIPEFQNT